MKFEINVRKKYFFGILAAIVIVALGIGVYAYNPLFGDPDYFGHTGNEIDGVVANANHANVADSCTSATTATTATNALSLGGVASNQFCSRSSGGCMDSSRLTWQSISGIGDRISIDYASWKDSSNRGNNAAVAYADIAGSANTISPSSGCYVCIREGKSNCPNPTQVTAWSCAPLSGGSISGWTNDDNGHCSQIKIDCDGDLQN